MAIKTHIEHPLTLSTVGWPFQPLIHDYTWQNNKLHFAHAIIGTTRADNGISIDWHLGIPGLD